MTDLDDDNDKACAADFVYDAIGPDAPNEVSQTQLDELGLALKK
ncbi:MAG: hypothetical protein WC683_16635 [bacterium]